MEKKQPDYKKSKNDPYDLDSMPTLRDEMRRSTRPNPYDLDQRNSYSSQKKDQKERK